MSERVFFETQALSGMELIAREMLALPGSVDLLGGVSQEHSAALNEAIADLLADSRFSDVVQVDADVPIPASIEGLGWQISRRKRDGVTQKARFLRLKGGWKTQAASLVGISVALVLSTVNPLSAAGVLVPTMTMIASVWDNLITLQRPQDNHAIDAYEGLLRALSQNDNRPRLPPTTEQIVGASTTDSNNTVSGLRRLRQLDLVEIVNWGGLSGDETNDRNQWLPRL
jgi:hypothetical protein